ncbi:Lipoyl synthase [Candidatus Erwinia haradaeae]|uniref:Lipoyl synthase n=1 Tax=Candidatus Erwinia haradaeae TaxID=1922217 RepID=A0A451DCX7_9GAMM|nr:lipoyl synthase [Candidatus Erwinia haradaeae]VFP84271.1 Lipoyl synthase [Candidatus Erwinia haradaeae]
MKELVIGHNILKTSNIDATDGTQENIRMNENLDILPKPKWTKIKLPTNWSNIQILKDIMRKYSLYSVCEEASCPNIYECFTRGVATFMILGATCTRRCPFCDVKHGRPAIPDINEPDNLANALYEMSIQYVVITSVDRDDLHDGGAQHFSHCISAIRKKNPSIKIEILVPDFRGCMERALKIISLTPPNVFNHNVENVPRIYNIVRPGANYQYSLKLLKLFKELHPDIPTKSGLMMGLGEIDSEVIEVMHDLRQSGVSMITIGQYLQPSNQHLPVHRYVKPETFDQMQKMAIEIGFSHATCGPLVRSSYHAENQIQELEMK